MKTKSETRWVIVGDCGLYTGQWLTRREAILEHVNMQGVPTEKMTIPPEIAHKWPYGNAPIYIVPVGQEALMKGWRYWRKQGDRAVKVKIQRIQ